MCLIFLLYIALVLEYFCLFCCTSARFGDRLSGLLLWDEQVSAPHSVASLVVVLPPNPKIMDHPSIWLY